MGEAGTGLTIWTYYDMDADVILQRGETHHDKPDWMRPGMWFHSSDDITRGEDAPISRKDRAWNIRGCHHVEYADGDILRALPETMTA